MDWKNRIVASGTKAASQFTPNPLNFRTHPQAQRDAVQGSLNELGFIQNVIENVRTGNLIDGHERVWQALQNNDAEVPYIQVDLSPEEEKLALAVLDPIGAMAETDDKILAELLKEVETDDAGLQALLDDMAGEIVELPEPGDGGDEFDTDAAMQGESRVKPGEIWLIDGGKHRLMCGDSTDGGAVALLMGGQKAGLCFTSPPYAQQRDYGEKAKEKVQDWDALMIGVFGCLGEVMTEDGQVLVNLGLVHRDGEWIPYWETWIEWMRSQGWRRFGWYVWDQGSGLPGDWNGRFAPSHEWMFHFNLESVRPEKIVDCDQRNVAIGKRATSKRLAGGSVTSMRSRDGVVKEVSSTKRNPTKIPDSVVRISRNATIDIARNNHPATFPIDLPALIIESWPGNIYDPFLGSGTTIIAGHRLGRRVFGMEIDERYCTVILNRCEAEGMKCERAV